LKVTSYTRGRTDARFIGVRRAQVGDLPIRFSGEPLRACLRVPAEDRFLLDGRFPGVNMSDIFVPGDALDEVSRSLAVVLDNIDTAAGGVDLNSVLGYPLIDAANNFEGRWSDGRIQLKRQCEEIRDAVDQIRTVMQDTDDKAAASLDNG
jgi:hypothetical protein